MEIRHATKHDISAISEVEAKCFPPSEAASEKAFTGRIENYGNHFWLMYENDKLIAFVDGFTTDESDLTDEMFADATIAQRKRCVADDFRREHVARISKQRICKRTSSPCC